MIKSSFICNIRIYSINALCPTILHQISIVIQVSLYNVFESLFVCPSFENLGSHNSLTCHLKSLLVSNSAYISFWVITGGVGGGGKLPYMGHIGMCGAKGYGFSAVLVMNRVSLLAILSPFW